MKSEYVLIHAAPIKHYGIKGQKKGVRRFQLNNGELTAAGKSRYGVSTSGNRPYSTPYSEPQDTASGRKKNVTGTTSGATVDKSKSYKVSKPNTTLEEKAPAATVGAKTQGAILKAHNAVRVTNQKNAIKAGADLADIASDRVKTREVITKMQSLFDNGAVDTLKKKMVKIKTGKNTRR